MPDMLLHQAVYQPATVNEKMLREQDSFNEQTMIVHQPAGKNSNHKPSSNKEAVNDFVS